MVEAGKLDTQTLEIDRRDLAGVRLIFYTNNDVDRFLASALIKDNFDVEKESTRVHHPTPENPEARYRGIHYTVRLRDDRIALPNTRGLRVSDARFKWIGKETNQVGESGEADPIVEAVQVFRGQA